MDIGTYSLILVQIWKSFVEHIRDKVFPSDSRRLSAAARGNFILLSEAKVDSTTIVRRRNLFLHFFVVWCVLNIWLICPKFLVASWLICTLGRNKSEEIWVGEGREILNTTRVQRPLLLKKCSTIICTSTIK